MIVLYCSYTLTVSKFNLHIRPITYLTVTEVFSLTMCCSCTSHQTQWRSSPFSASWLLSASPSDQLSLLFLNKISPPLLRSQWSSSTPRSVRMFVLSFLSATTWTLLALFLSLLLLWVLLFLFLLFPKHLDLHFRSLVKGLRGLPFVIFPAMCHFDFSWFYP